MLPPRSARPALAEKTPPVRPLQKEVSAGVIVFRRTKDGPVFLVLYNGGDYWNFPKGKIEREERSFETALRETGEETGIDPKDMRVSRHFRTQERFVFRRDRRNIAKTIIFYLAETRRAKVILAEKTHGERHQGYGWFPYREAVRILGKYRESQRVLKEAYEFLRRKSDSGGGQNPAGPNPNVQGSGAPRRESQRLPRSGERAP
jgi:8-oxo-dGTP pyrophosphatase MutT (NUDIX family)